MAFDVQVVYVLLIDSAVYGVYACKDRAERMCKHLQTKSALSNFTMRVIEWPVIGERK